MSKCLCREQIAAPNPRSNLNMTRASIMLARATQGRKALYPRKATTWQCHYGSHPVLALFELPPLACNKAGNK